MLRILSRGSTVMQSFMWSYLVIGYWPCLCQRPWSPLPAGFVPTTLGWIAKCFIEDFRCQAPHYEKGWSMYKLFFCSGKRRMLYSVRCMPEFTCWRYLISLFHHFSLFFLATSSALLCFGPYVTTRPIFAEHSLHQPGSRWCIGIPAI